MRTKLYIIVMAIFAVVVAAVYNPNVMSKSILTVNFIYYVIIAIGAVMVYGSNKILGLFKKDDSIGAIIALKMSGLAVAILGMLLVMHVI